MLDYKVAEVNQLITMITNEKIDYDQNISRMKVKLVSMSEQEQALDKEIEQILGRAIDGKDLRLLYELDIKTLNQLNIGCNNKFDGFVQHFVSIATFYVVLGECHYTEVLQGICRQKRSGNYKVHEETFCSSALGKNSNFKFSYSPTSKTS